MARVTGAGADGPGVRQSGGRGASGKRPGGRRLQRQQEIVDIAARLFARQGYSATGIAELCEAVGMGRGALYHYIGCKEYLLLRIHDRVMAEVLQSARDIEDLQAPASERLRMLRMLGIELMRIITQYPDHVWVFLHEWRVLRGQEAADFRAKRHRYEATVERILREGVERGEFEIGDVRLAVRAWLGLHNYTYQWFQGSGRLNAFQIANQYYDMFVHRIGAKRT
ncbi:TetR/AcrR family transcriptional regulator [Pseudonocardia nigra]|uniref:TetR/AcrR family transcriptional regulator n=1 Tax=Pseudonocardia nigra TaxID=1921578 RepID=UPI001C5DD337|nr:TetR/AcrR family transcriptional regulator [Pseudonocardia nigra]